MVTEREALVKKLVVSTQGGIWGGEGQHCGKVGIARKAETNVKAKTSIKTSTENQLHLAA